MTLRLFFLLFCCNLLLVSCESNGEWQDEGISPEIRKEIGLMNEKLLQAFKENDETLIRSMGGDSIKYAHKDSLAVFIEEVNALRLDSTAVRKQFYLRNRKGRRQKISTGTGEHDFFFHAQQIERDMFISIIDIKDSLTTTSLTFIYGRTGSKSWKVHGMRTGVYKILGRDAITWYRMAEDLYVKGAEVDAYLKHSIALLLINPVAEYAHYHKERDMLDLKTDLLGRIENEYVFPAAATYATGEPEVFNIASRFYNGDLYPVIFVKTSIPLSDTAAISRQCDEIHAGLDRLYNKLNRNEHLLYDVYNNIPEIEEEGGKVMFVKHALKKYWQYRD